MFPLKNNMRSIVVIRRQVQNRRRRGISLRRRRPSRLMWSLAYTVQHLHRPRPAGRRQTDGTQDDTGWLAGRRDRRRLPKINYRRAERATKQPVTVTCVDELTGTADIGDVDTNSRTTTELLRRLGQNYCTPSKDSHKIESVLELRK